MTRGGKDLSQKLSMIAYLESLEEEAIISLKGKLLRVTPIQQEKDQEEAVKKRYHWF